MTHQWIVSSIHPEKQPIKQCLIQNNKNLMLTINKSLLSYFIS